jgi:hypothetical protein
MGSVASFRHLQPCVALFLSFQVKMGAQLALQICVSFLPLR